MKFTPEQIQVLHRALEHYEELHEQNVADLNARRKKVTEGYNKLDRVNANSFWKRIEHIPIDEEELSIAWLMEQIGYERIRK